MGNHFLDLSKHVIEFAARGVELAAALVIAFAALGATLKSFLLLLRRSSTPEEKNEIRLTMGRWLAVALELELGADILNTAVTPTWTDIGKLAAIAAIRTALNYFLEKEIDAESSPAQQAAEAKVTGPHASVTSHRS